MERRPSLGCSPACSAHIPQDLQLWVWLSHTPENSRCTVWAPQEKWWHSAHITAADSARNPNLGLRGDRLLFPVFTLSLTISLPVFIWHMAGREGWQGGTSHHSWPIWAMVSLGFGIQRPITRTQPNGADLSYPWLTECTIVQLLKRRDFEKFSSRCFHTLLPLLICRTERRLIDCWRLNTSLVRYYKLKDQWLYNWIHLICIFSETVLAHTHCILILYPCFWCSYRILSCCVEKQHQLLLGTTLLLSKSASRMHSSATT